MKTPILFLFMLLCAAITSLQTIHAATITVMNTNNSGAGSLRQALADANDGDTINFAAAVTGTITLTSGELLVNDSITISGPGADVLAVDGNHASRVFHIARGKTVTIASLKIANGSTFASGGGIFNDHATLTVNNCTVSDNSAANGAGIHNNGNSGVGSATLTVINSTISGNSTNFFGGGGIFNDGFGSGQATLSVIDSTINNNTALEVGGGIRSEGGQHGSATASVRNSTISGNTATGATNCCEAVGGGGIQNDGKNGGSASLEIVNSTFSGNAANLGGGGIYNEARHTGGATVTLGDTIFNAGSSGENIHNDSGTVTSLGYNLSSDDASTFLNGPGDQNSTAPMLDSLQDNGGPTFTHGLLTGSPAFNAGDPNFTPPPSYDQRGAPFARVANGRIDIGSFEVQNCPQSQGYWKNNPGLWPVESLMLGNQTYTKAELLTILNTPIGASKNADASLILADQLIAANLNIANGADGTPVQDTIDDADTLLSGYGGKLPYHVRPNSTNGQQMVNDAATLEVFNKAMLTIGCGG